MEVVPPGGHRSWLTVLPEPFSDNPTVVVVMIPDKSNISLEALSEGVEAGVLTTPRGTRRVLQFIEPHLEDWVEHEVVAQQFDMQLADPDYIGPLETLPRRFLMSTVRYPLVFLQDAPWKPPLNLKKYVWSLTSPEEDGN